jgi:hypothetical protein
MVIFGLSNEQFLSMFEKWASVNGIDISNHFHQTRIKDAYIYWRRQCPCFLKKEKKTGKTYLYLPRINNGEIKRQNDQILMITQKGNVQSYRNHYSGRRQAANHRENVINSKYSKMPITARTTAIPPEDILQFADDHNCLPPAKRGTDYIFSCLCNYRLIGKSSSFNNAAKNRAKAEWREHIQQFMFLVERRARTHAIRSFINELDPQCVETMRLTGHKNAEIYNWLNAENHPEKREVRNQAARQHPVLIPFMTGTGNVTSGKIKNEISQHLTKTIGRREQLINSVQKVFARNIRDLPKSAARFIMKLKNDDLPDIAWDNLYNLIKALNHINPNWYPKNPGEWEDFNTCVNAFSIYRRATGAHITKDFTNPATMEKCLLETKGNWKKYAEIIKNHGQMRDVSDWADVILTRLIKPAVIFNDKEHDEAAARAFGKFLKNAKFREILEASKRWHDQAEAFSAKFQNLASGRDNNSGVSWVPLSESVQAPNGIWLRPLTTPGELQEESDVQKHCVSEYAAACFEGASHIISLSEDRDGLKRLTTAELEEQGQWSNPENLWIKTRQHRGPENCGAGKREQEALY